MEYENTKDIYFKNGVENILKIVEFYNNNELIGVTENFIIDLSTYNSIEKDKTNVNLYLRTSKLMLLYKYNILDEKDCINSNIDYYQLLSLIMKYVTENTTENILFEISIKD